MSIRLSDIPDTEIKTKGIRLSDIPDEQPKFNGKPKASLYSELVAPILEGGSTFAAGLPRLVAKAQGPGMEEATFPEQQTVPGKILRGVSEVVGLTAGLPGQAAKWAGRGVGKVAGKVIPRFAGKALLSKVAQGAGAGAVGMATGYGNTLQEREKNALMGAVLGGVMPLVAPSGKIIAKGISIPSRWIAKNIGGITDSTVNTIKRLGSNKVFDPLKAKADYISQNLAPKIYDRFNNFIKTSHDLYNKAINSVPEGKSINIRPAIEKAGNELKQLGLITEKGSMTELGNSEIARDSVYGKLLDFYQSADAISGIGKLQGKALTGSQILKTLKASKETNINKKQFLFFRDKLNSLYKNKPSDIDVSGVRDAFYKSGEDAGMKGLNAAKDLENKVFEIGDKVDVNKISKDLIKAKNPQWTKVVEGEYKDLVKKGIITDKDYKEIFDDLMAHFANIDFELVSETPGVGGGFYPSRSGIIRKAVAGGTKQYYKNIVPRVEKFSGKVANKSSKIIKWMQK